MFDWLNGGRRNPQRLIPGNKSAEIINTRRNLFRSLARQRARLAMQLFLRVKPGSSCGLHHRICRAVLFHLAAHCHFVIAVIVPSLLTYS